MDRSPHDEDGLDPGGGFGFDSVGIVLLLLCVDRVWVLHVRRLPASSRALGVAVVVMVGCLP